MTRYASLGRYRYIFFNLQGVCIHLFGVHFSKCLYYNTEIFDDQTFILFHAKSHIQKTNYGLALAFSLYK